jgi:MerR family transcriptional regulator, light-induced transcriptional regulator
MDELNRSASEALLAAREQLSEAVVARKYAQEPEFWERYGAIGRQRSLEDANYHFAYLAEALSASDPLLFMDYLKWVKVLFQGLGFPDDVLTTTLACMLEASREQLPPDLQPPVTEYLEAGLKNLPQLPSAIPTFLREEAPLTPLAGTYLQALLRGERSTACRLILDAVAQGTGIKDIYLQVFQPTQHEIGRLWQTNRLSVAQEHYCTAATQLIMSQLYPHIFATEKIGRRLVATSVGGELHEIGIRMVADFFELEGWDTYYVGANTPAESVLRTIIERDANVLAISATMTFHVRSVVELIARVRDKGRQTIILVGGYPFNVSSELWRTVGADGYASDAEAAVIAANRLVEEKVRP